ncbi:MAG: hypothetical protein U1F16_03955 [Turneriella sp.]
MELEITWGRIWRIWWAYVWRNVLMTIVAMILGGIMGFIIGFFFGLLGVDQQVTQLVVTPLGFLLGLGLSVFPMRMILGKNFGEFRLVLVRNEIAEKPPVDSAPVAPPAG